MIGRFLRKPIIWEGRLLQQQPMYGDMQASEAQIHLLAVTGWCATPLKICSPPCEPFCLNIDIPKGELRLLASR